MERSHKEVIRRHCETLVKKMNADKVAMHLHNVKILTDEMKENLEAEKSCFSKSRKLLEIIIRRGPHAFTALRMALIKAGNFLLAKELQKDVNPIPIDGEEEMESSQPLVIDLDKETENTASQQVKEPEKDNNQQRYMANIGDNFYVVANTYKDQLKIHIREYQATENGKLFPTKKGVTFPLCRWLLFTTVEPDVTECLKSHSDLESEKAWHLRGGVYATITPKYPTVNIRHFWKPKFAPKPLPTKKGVILTRFRFEKLKEVMKEITEHVPELEETTLCMCQDDHMNQEGMLRCPECTPFGYDELDSCC